MNPAFKFNKMFGLHLSDRLDGTLYSLLIINLFFFSLIIFGVTRLDYSRFEKQWNETIKERYKEFISELIINSDKEQIEYYSSLKIEEHKRAAARERAARLEEKKIEQSVSERFKSNVSSKEALDDVYGYLPDAEEIDPLLETADPPQLSYRAKTWPSSEGTRAVSVNNFDAGNIHNPLKRPFNYLVNRQGDIFINLTDELVDEPLGRNGYRNPEEIERIVSGYQPMIEHCFKKASYMSPGIKGYVKVSFNISPEGFVIPESIRIIDSTIRSKRFEQCVKSYIKRWRNFEKLDESMGIARVVQKFVFN